MDTKTHWENVFATKHANEVSWTQENPTTVLAFIEEIGLDKNTNIIDVGGGESFLAEKLLDKGFKNIWVLDISKNALTKAKERLGDRANLIHWVVADITEFKSDIKFDFWNDRAVFHFLTDEKQVEKYISIIENTMNESGYFLLGTFSENGPEKCSGLCIKQYSETAMKAAFRKNFEALNCFTEDHKTPFNTIQNFQFCKFQFNKLLS